MEALLTDFLDVYKEHLYLITEYNFLNNKIKDVVKNRGGKLLLGSYSLRVSSVDKSIFSNDIVDYLKSNNLSKYLIRGVNTGKVKDLMNKNKLSKEFVLESIKYDKTVLDIIAPDVVKEIKKYEESLKEYDLLKMIQRRVLLREKTRKSKSLYYEKAKFIKDMLRFNGLTEYRFEYKNTIGLLRIRIVERVYDDDFMDYCTDNELDIFDYKIDNLKLRTSKIKRVVNSEYLRRNKVEKKEDYLYIRTVERKTVSR